MREQEHKGKAAGAAAAGSLIARYKVMRGQVDN
jgi:hypothetical protein